jgi:hypothetical protein
MGLLPVKPAEVLLSYTGSDSLCLTNFNLTDENGTVRPIFGIRVYASPRRLTSIWRRLIF